MSEAARVASVRLRHGGGTLPLAVSNSAARWTERHGLLLEVRTDKGLLGTGEASPLPGYSSDTLAECADELARLDAGAFDALDPARCDAAELRAWLAGHPLSPAARFAVETALIELASQMMGTPKAELLGSPIAPHPVPLAALLPAGDLERGAKAALARGLRTLKVKIGAPRAFDRELTALRGLRQAIGPRVNLRLDANGAFALDEAQDRLAALAELNPEFIEEPLPLGQLAAFAMGHASPIPLAADESLRTPAGRDGLRRAFASGRVAIAVLKPTVLGGALACLDLAAELTPLGTRFVATHAFEGPVALAAARVLASVLPQQGVAQPEPAEPLAAGLDDHPALAAWGQA